MKINNTPKTESYIPPSNLNSDSNKKILYLGKNAISVIDGKKILKAKELNPALMSANKIQKIVDEKKFFIIETDPSNSENGQVNIKFHEEFQFEDLNTDGFKFKNIEEIYFRDANGKIVNISNFQISTMTEEEFKFIKTCLLQVIAAKQVLVEKKEIRNKETETSNQIPINLKTKNVVSNNQPTRLDNLAPSFSNKLYKLASLFFKQTDQIIQHKKEAREIEKYREAIDKKDQIIRKEVQRFELLHNISTKITTTAENLMQIIGKSFQ